MVPHWPSNQIQIPSPDAQRSLRIPASSLPAHLFQTAHAQMTRTTPTHQSQLHQCTSECHVHLLSTLHKHHLLLLLQVFFEITIKRRNFLPLSFFLSWLRKKITVLQALLWKAAVPRSLQFSTLLYSRESTYFPVIVFFWYWPPWF